jgi:hypothetical protein
VKVSPGENFHVYGFYMYNIIQNTFEVMKNLYSLPGIKRALLHTCTLRNHMQRYAHSCGYSFIVYEKLAVILDMQYMLKSAPL